MKPDLTKLKGSVILITGGTGLIGSALVKSLKNADAVVCTPTHQELDRIRILPFADIIFHAAGYGEPSVFMQRPIETIKVNTETTVRLLQHLRPGGSFLFCSSSEVYSGLDYQDGPATEEDIGTTTPAHPRACYIEGKRCGETIVNAFRKSGVRAASARIAQTYGPGTRKHDTRAVNQFIAQALINKKIELRDSGHAVRTYGYIDDVVEMLWNIALNGTKPVYNVGGRSVITIANLVRIIGRLTGADFSITEDISDQTGGTDTVHLDLTRIETEFGKTDYIDLDEGLKRTIEYQRGLYD